MKKLELTLAVLLVVVVATSAMMRTAGEEVMIIT